MQRQSYTQEKRFKIILTFEFVWKGNIGFCPWAIAQGTLHVINELVSVWSIIRAYFMGLQKQIKHHSWVHGIMIVALDYLLLG